MRLGIFVFVLIGSLVVSVRAQADPAPVDIKTVRQDLRVLHDGKGHYFVAILTAHEDDDDFVFYGDGKTFYRQRIYSSSRSGTELSKSFWEPRSVMRTGAAFSYSDAGSTIRCDGRETPFVVLDPPQAAKILEGARFLDSRWNFIAYAMARDDEGRYYYVDRERKPENSRRFRLFTGYRGEMKVLHMRNVVSDSEGDVFQTKSGDLRFVLDKKEALWVKGKKRKTLKLVPPEKNVDLIYSALGVYSGQALGTPCDDL